jgi:cellulose synthase/poly-beta-1,6-N-acetylglucosamine synthase-like glycosyltransferase
MMAWAWGIWLLCIILILHTYLFYPIIIQLLSKKLRNRTKFDNQTSQSYQIAVLIAAYNEEQIIRSKLLSVLENIPKNVKLDVFVGSDGSTDSTNEIVLTLKKEFDNLHLIHFQGRSGKATIINKLADNNNYDIFILTDANVIFQSNTIEQLIIPFDDTKIQLVCANIQKKTRNSSSFEAVEKFYLDRENKIKLAESRNWNLVIGAEGGCYAIRCQAYSPIPTNFFMDDFFMTMQVLEKKGNVVFQEKAICFEDIPNQVSEEFKRKIRISIGNFQNLNRFKHLLFPIWDKTAFAFWSHKVLRWLTPFFLIFILLSSIVLSFQYKLMLVFLLVQGVLITCVIFSGKNSNYIRLNALVHFYFMNIALLIGFFRFLKGVESSVWNPTLRNTTNK